MVNKSLSVKKKPYRTRYAGSNRRGGKRGGVTITLQIDPRKGICDACKKSIARGEIKTTHLHHWWYAYIPKTVKANPILVLDNTSELCYYCHKLADSIRGLLYAKPLRVAWVAGCLKDEPRNKFIQVLEAVQKSMKTEKNIKDNALNILKLIKNGGRQS